MEAFEYGDVSIYFHKTKELIYVVNGICDLIITMNVSTSLLRNIANKETVLYFLSAYQEPSRYVKQAIRIQSHIKLYRTKEYVFFSTANLSMSNFDEMTIRFKRTPEIDMIVQNILFRLSPLPPFLLS